MAQRSQKRHKQEVLEGRGSQQSLSSSVMKVDDPDPILSFRSQQQKYLKSRKIKSIWGNVHQSSPLLLATGTDFV